MKGNVLNQPSVQEYYREHFLLFPVDIEGDVEIVNFMGETMTQKEWAKRSRVRATPVIDFYDLDGKRVHRHISKTSGVEEFMIMGEYVAGEHYKTIRFTPYKKLKNKK
jgi:thioredoxin-related protein